MPKRPFFHDGIKDLKAKAENAASDPELRRALLDELACRTSAGAKKLEAFLKEQNKTATKTDRKPLTSSKQKTKRPKPIQKSFLDKEETDGHQQSRFNFEEPEQSAEPATRKVKIKRPEKTQKKQHSFKKKQKEPVKKKKPKATPRPGQDDDGPLVTEEVREPIDNLINAMRLEISAAKKSAFDSEIKLINGKKVESGSDRYIYRFTLERDVSIQEDTPVELVIASSSADGTVAAIQERSILIALNEDLGSFIPVASIRQDATFLIKVLCEKFREIKRGENPSFRLDMIEKILGQKEASYGNEAPPAGLSQQIPPLTPKQSEALRSAMGSEITWIWGPPGCGKSHTLAPIIEAFHKKDKRILVCANTNRAVDTLLVKLCENLSKSRDDGFQHGAVIRQGKIVDKKLLKYAPQIDLEQIIERLGKGLRKQKSELSQAINDLSHRLTPYQRMLDEFTKLDQVTTEFRKSQSDLDAAHNLILKHQHHEQQIGFTIKRCEEEASKKGQGLKFFESLAEAFGGRTIEEIEEELKSLHIERREFFDKIEFAIDEHRNLQRALAVVEHDYDRLTNSLAGRDRQSIERSHSDLKSEQNNIRSQLSKVDQKLANLKKEILKNSRIIAATTTKAYTSADDIGVFDIAIIDEASMLPLPHVVYIAGMSSSQIIVSGDFRQLPPISMGARDYDLVKNWYGKDPFDRAGITSIVNAGKSHPGLVELDIQFRSTPKLIVTFNELFYNGRLKSDPEAGFKDLPNSFPSLIEEPFTIIDTSDAAPCTSSPGKGRGRYNILHAFTARNLIIALKATGFTVDGSNIGYISPYRLQAQLVESMREEARVGAGKTGTVHGFQGSEASCIIYDTTESPPLYPTPFSTADTLEDDGAKLLNVALSRAEHRMVIIANLDFLQKKLNSSAYLSQVLQMLLHGAQVIKSEELLNMLGPNAPANQNWFVHLNADMNLEGSYWLNETNFHEALLSDINQAEKHIVIYSGFATPQATARIIEPLRERLKVGVIVRIVTRDPNNMGSIHPDQARDSLDALAKIGCHLDLRSEMHQKVIIIDGHVIYNGSLNALSFTGKPEESMLRCESPAACLSFATQDRWRVPSGFDSNKADAATIFEIFAQTENVRCPECEGLMVYYAKARFGPFLRCIEDKTHTLSARDVDRQITIDPDLKNKKMQCPACDSKMVLRRGWRGPFWGCSRYPECAETVNIDSNS